MMNSIRILHGVGNMNRGGIETMLMNLYRSIDRTKVQFDFIEGPNKYAYDDEIEELGGHIHRVSHENPFKFPNEFQEILKIYPEYKVFHVHMPNYKRRSIHISIAKKKGLLTIVHSHNANFFEWGNIIVDKKYKIKPLLGYVYDNYSMHINIRYADYCFACSIDAGKSLFGIKVINRKNFKVLPNAINVNKFIFDPEVRKKNRFGLGISDKHFVIGHVGRFSPEKNHSFLISVFKKIHDKYSNALLLLVGDGNIRGKIEEQVKNLGLNNNVLFTGIRSDVNNLYQVMDVFVLPSLFEGLGMVAVEAQASGLKCILSDGVPQEAKMTDLVEYLSLSDSVELWAEKILSCVNEYDREKYYKNIIEAGYDVNETAKWLEKFYLDLYESMLRNDLID